MVTRCISFLLCLLLLALVALPAQAQPSDPKPNQKPDSSAMQPADNNKASNAPLPTRLVAFATGLMVGMPIAMVRKSAQGVVNVTRYMAGESNNPLLLGAYGLTFGLTFGISSGAVDGVLFCVKNSWQYSDDKPFSKESFSLGDLN